MDEKMSLFSDLNNIASISKMAVNTPIILGMVGCIAYDKLTKYAKTGIYLLAPYAISTTLRSLREKNKEIDDIDKKSTDMHPEKIKLIERMDELYIIMNVTMPLGSLVATLYTAGELMQSNPVPALVLGTTNIASSLYESQRKQIIARENMLEKIIESNKEVREKQEKINA